MGYLSECPTITLGNPPDRGAPLHKGVKILKEIVVISKCTKQDHLKMNVSPLFRSQQDIGGRMDVFWSPIDLLLSYYLSVFPSFLPCLAFASQYQCCI